ncbi:hypothetical protein HRbin33_02041 [bacterium HR33]|nr:hypothetical protein HRbin33_02041 [bacterium HR33]
MLVYDLSPFDERALGALEAFRRHHPAAVVMFYVPIRSGIEPLLVRALARPGSWLKFQLPAAYERSLVCEALQQALRMTPGLRVRQALQPLEGSLRPPYRRLIEQVLAELELGRLPRLKCLAVAGDGFPTIRTLERAAIESGLPSPKKICMWLTLLFVEFASAGLGVPAARVARSVGLDSNAWYRLRRRLIGGFSGSSPRCDSQADLVARAFLNACGAGVISAASAA